MKDTEQIVKMLRQHRMGCFGCGYEHNCRDNGCALMQMAANELEKLTHHTEPENKPLTLEQLKRMDREPVWIQGSDTETSGWALIKGKREKQIANCPDDWNISYYLKDYGKTWIAYPRKMEQEATL